MASKSKSLDAAKVQAPELPALSEKQQKRLEKLLQQTEHISEFLVKNSQDGTDSAANKGKNKSRAEDEVSIGETQAFMHFEESPTYIKGEMRDYQIVGLNWLVSLYENDINGILADEMGLGKTLQTIAMIGYLVRHKRKLGPHIVIVPLSTLQNWANEMKRFCLSLKVVTLHGNQEQRDLIFRKQLKDKKSYNVVLTTYEMCLSEENRLRRIPFQYLVVDEAHRIKNEKSLLANVLRRFQSENRLLLTGTPLQNNLHELWALLNFLLPDIFGSSDDFDEWFNTENCLTNTDMVQRLHGILKPFLLRRVKAQVEKSLLPKQIIKVYVGMSQMQREWYQKVLTKEIYVLNNLNQPQKMRLENIFMQLRKVTNHPYLFPLAEPGPPFTTDTHILTNSGKMHVLDKLLKKLKQEGSRVLLFSQMTRMLDILEDFCCWREYEYSRFDGGTQRNKRDEIIDEYNAPDSKKFIFLLSTRAGGLGINLTSADTVIIYDSDWNPQMDLQAMDRAHRIGQKKQVRVFRLLTERTADVRMDERASLKLRLDKMVIQKGHLVDGKDKLSGDEMRQLINRDADYIMSSKESYIKDDDIEQILAESEKRTATEQAMLDTMDEEALRAFQVNAHETPYMFEGADMRKKKTKIPRVWKVESPLIKRKLFDFQFLPKRLHELAEIEASGDPLTMEESMERAQLLTEGFPEWDEQDFERYIQLLMRFGRGDMKNVVKYFESSQQSKVMEYHKVFMQRYKEIKNWKVIMNKIEKAEAAHPSFVQLFKYIEQLINWCDDPYNKLKTTPAKVRNMHLDEAAMRYLFCMFYECGMGSSNFALIHKRIQNDAIANHELLPAKVEKLNEEDLEKVILAKLTEMFVSEQAQGFELPANLERISQDADHTKPLSLKNKLKDQTIDFNGNAVNTSSKLEDAVKLKAKATRT